MTRPYHEMMVRGSRGRTRGFLEGFLAERGVENAMIVADEEGFACETLAERLREILHPGEETLHLLVPSEHADLIRETVAAASASGVEAALAGERKVTSARFAFRLRAYAREPADRIRAYFRGLPEGVHLGDSSRFEEIVDPLAKGVESYAPAHEFELRGSGTVEGSIPGVLEVYRKCRDDDLVDAESIELIE